MPTRRHDAVLFDAGETLVHPHPSFGLLLAQFLGERGHTIDAGAFEPVALDVAIQAGVDAHTRGIAWTTSAEASRAHWTGLYRTLLERLEIDDDEAPDALYDRFSMPVHYRLFDDALPALRELAAEGYSLAIVSNWESWLPSLLDLLGVTEMFGTVVVSGVEGIEKPDRAIFTAALDRLGVEPSLAVHVGDSVVHDVEPALSLGMSAVLLDRHGKHPNGSHHSVRSLAQLASLLPTLRSGRHAV